MRKEKIAINIIYDKELKKITGKYAERLSIPSGSTSLDFVNFLLEKYSKIKKIPPTRFGFERNSKIPKASQVLEDGDRYKFVVHDDDGGYGPAELEKIEDLFKEAEKILGLQASREELVDFVSERVPRGEYEEIMTWLDCAWKRIACGKDSCPICGKIKRDRERLVREGKNPDSIQSAFDNLGANLAEAMALIQKDAEAMGMNISNLEDIADAPEAKFFPLAVRAEKWYLSIMNLYNEKSTHGTIWLLTEEALDLNWYAGTFNAKVYRQLCNKWYLDNKKDYSNFDYNYTSRVLKEVSEIIDKSFTSLLPTVSDFKSLHRDFYLINKEVQKL
ncbi:MAG: hypothetical protein Q7S49_02415 [bacterium]|nr:hypothetical protein [bacterium]